MHRRPPESTRTYPICPSPALFRSRVSDHVEVRPSDVEVALAPAREQPRGGAVDDDPDAGDERYGQPVEVGRIADALNRIEHDRAERDEQQHRVDRKSTRLNPSH